MRRATRFGRSEWFEVLEAQDWTLLAAVLLLPWAFGGVEIWAYRTAALLLTVSATLAVWGDGWDGLGLDRRARWLLPAALLAVWAAVQIVPLPSAVVGALSPRAAAIYRTTFPDYGGQAPADMRLAIEQQALAAVPEADGVADPRPQRERLAFETGGRWTGWRPLSLLPSMGAERLAWFGALLLGFLVVRRRCREPEVARAYRRLLFLDVGLLAIFGLVYAATSNGKLYWIRAPLESFRPMGPYVNPNNFAAAMELVFPWITAYALVRWTYAPRGRRDRELPLLAAGAALCMLATFVAASKSSPFFELAALTVLGLIAARGPWRKATVLVMVAVLVLGVILVIPHTYLGQRLADYAAVNAEGAGGVTRLVSAHAALTMFGDYTIAGAGFGAFRDVFPHYMPPGGLGRWSQLHDDWLEFAVEGGAIGIVLLAWLLFGFWGRLVRPASFRGERGVDLELLGLVLGLCALSLHALFDFNHQIPANALLFVTLGGIAIARVEGRQESAPAPPAHRRRPGRLALVVLSLLAVGATVRAVGGWIAGPAYSSGKRLAVAGHYDEAMSALDSAALGPLRPVVLWLRAQVRLGQWQRRLVDGEGIDRAAELFVPAYREYTEALSLSPASGWYRAGLGDLYRQVERLERWNLGTPLDVLGGKPWAAVGRPGRIAVGLTREAIDREPETFTFRDQLAFTLLDYDEREAALEAVRQAARVQPLWEQHAFDNLDPAPDDVIDAFIEASRSVIGATPYVPRVLHLISLGTLETRREHYPQAEQDLRAALEAPGHELNRANAHYLLGRVYQAEERWPDADEQFVLASEHPRFRAAATASRAQVAEAEDRVEEALELYREARRLRPRDIAWTLAFARVARRLDLDEQARQALKWGILIAPRDVRPLSRLIELNLDRHELAQASANIEHLARIDPENPVLSAYRSRLAPGGA